LKRELDLTPSGRQKNKHGLQQQGVKKGKETQRTAGTREEFKAEAVASAEKETENSGNHRFF
jgi:hypothetical protein